MLETITEPLVNWYEQGHRILPWRQKKDPYEIWVSEIMLQQTRVEAVKPYYERFMNALPNVEALAACPEEQLLKLWEGLGYYNRVRNMQKAAEIVVTEYQGILPSDYDLLKSLPGIGSYTAGAVASIAYNIPVPAVDGNVFRVLSRLREDPEDITKQSHRVRVEQELLQIIPKEVPGVFNQALMELGAMVCVPNGEPKCGICPLYAQCLAGKNGTWMDYPVKKKAKPRRIEEITVFLLMDSAHAVIRKRPKKGLLSGLYEFPNVSGKLDEKEALGVVTDLGLTPIQIRKLPDAKHIFSHVEWHMTGYAVKIEEPDSVSEKGLIFAEIDQTGVKYPIPAAFAAYARFLNLKIGQEKYEE